MSCLKVDFSVSGSSNILVKNQDRGSSRVLSALRFRDSNLNEVWGKSLKLDNVYGQRGVVDSGIIKRPKLDAVYAQASVSFGKALKWWEKSLQPNMVEIGSAQDLVDHLINGGDRLVVIDFYSPGCGGCKALHPKICQIAESNLNVVFLMVNYEQHKEMCYALHVHVLPFFRFYRGADGKVCSFSCTNATIKKFRDALAKHGTDRCSLGPAKGLSEAEMSSLAAIGQISLELAPTTAVEEEGSECNKMGVKEEDKAAAIAMAS
ncbi:thioredoxin-like 1-1, chloroplastic [Andrographis paniculata]|uniref:thioredoxin-like 1-1, chloroplastic n=1 Tax=Andrographis paniculata TaxID=175694 RepID=UPI0021E9122C|nr:thioredoxin-like 1-1, chloroplastic [Andrographis paniculata]